MPVRLRIPELLDERGWTAYQLAKESGGRIALSTAYRLADQRGALKLFPAELLDSLAATFKIDICELFDRPVGSRTKRTRSREGGI